jgi:hypothetical protein
VSPVSLVHGGLRAASASDSPRGPLSGRLTCA